ncbi:GNAT family N-acetyltransferase [Patescibacteria group bacterium]|nr:GNAT family N-acetyltransferase [Patescibacteria group bacterium]
MDLDIRLVDEKDIAILDKHLSFGTPGKHQKRVALQKEDKGLYLIAWEGDVPIGHVFIKLDGPGEQAVKDAVGTFPNLEDLLVVEEKRERGVGTKIMKEVERQLCERNYKKLGFGVGIDELKTIEFYKALGYGKADVEPFKVSWKNEKGEKDGETCIYLTKDLSCS